jgi:integrase
LHGLRHYFATLLIHNGAAVKVVQLAFGHSTTMITLNTYAHEWPDTLDRTRTLVDAARSDRARRPLPLGRVSDGELYRCCTQGDQQHC